MSDGQNASSLEYEDLFENAPCGYLLLDRDGRVGRANKTICNWLDIAADQLQGKRFRDLMTMPGRILFETHFSPLLRTKGFFNEVALDLMAAGGSLVPVLVNASEKRDGDGKLILTRVAIFQTAERRRWERELVEARMAANEAEKSAKTDLDREREESELREQFIAVLGHDLRNPLASISAAANLLSKDDPSTRSMRIIEMMRGSVNRMSGLIDNVLDFARGRLGGGISLARENYESLEVVLNQVVDELRVGQPSGRINVDVEPMTPVYCDPGRIGQLVSNLLGNALAHGAVDDPVHVGAFTRDDELVLWVANAGPAIPSAKIDRLFHPFFRGDSRDNHKGLGLGLHIASEIARAHGGTLAVTSSDLETRFTLSMPASARD